MISEKNKRHPLFKWLLVVGIMLVANLFLNYALDAFYPRPQYETFCPTSQVEEAVLTKDACIAKGGQWTESVTPKGAYSTTPVVSPTAPELIGYCNQNYTCGKNYDAVTKVYDRNVFIVLVVAGTVFLIGSIFAAELVVVALGFSLAGILSLIIGTMRYWSSMDEKLRVVVLGIALVSLIWVGVKKFKN